MAVDFISWRKYVYDACSYRDTRYYDQWVGRLESESEQRKRSLKVMSRGTFPMRGWFTRGMTRINLHVSFYLRLPHEHTVIFSTRTSLICNDGVHVAPPVAAPE